MPQKKSDSTDIWAWINEDMDRLYAKGGLWQSMLENYHEFFQLLHNDPLAAELAISQALNAAQETGELKWQLHLRHWRLQLWLEQRQVKRVLPEAIDLLALATDQRVRDVPQRICAYHDVVDCYVDMDPAGYYQEIVENSADILAQLPKKHPCATCARLHIAQAAAATGREREAEHWLNQLNALRTEMYPGLAYNIALAKISLAKWPEAEQAFKSAVALAQQGNQGSTYLKSVLGLVRVALEKQDLQQAFEWLQEGRRSIKYMGGNAQMALLAETEGRFFAATHQEAVALSYLNQAAQSYLDLGCYRDAAQTALYAAEFAQHAQISAEEALNLAAKSVGQMPETSQDMYTRLAAFGKEPVLPTKEQQIIAISSEEQGSQELADLQHMLHLHITNGHIRNVATTLYQLGRWHLTHEEYRAAVEYLLFNATLERLLKLPMRDREDALGMLSKLQIQLPTGTIEAALASAESAPPAWLKPLISDVSSAQWSWLIRATATEIAGKPVVEPEPTPTEHGEDAFQEWIERVASMTALLVRLQSKLEPDDSQPWISSLQETELSLAKQKQEFSAIRSAEEMRAIETENAVLTSFVRGLLALAQGASIREVQRTVPEPFSQVILQIGEVAQRPSWFHPGWSPLDVLVEHAAQEAVYALRQQDDHHTSRLKNLALRYILMQKDMEPEQSLQTIAQFLAALQKLLLSDGQELPTLAPLPNGDESFQTILNAVYEASKKS